MLLCWLTGRSTTLSMKDLLSLDDAARAWEDYELPKFRISDSEKMD